MILESSEAWHKVSASVRNADKVLIGIGTEMKLSDKTDDSSLRKAYGNLKGLLTEKDYYIVSLCMDDMIYTAFEREDNVVCPCGGTSMLQCEDVCTKELYPTIDTAPDVLPYLKADQMGTAEELLPPCPHCGKRLVFNNILAEHYLEEGYLDQWERYLKWVQSTVNRKLCILEIGVSMQFPNIIRWAFDKLAYFNQKAEFYRIHTSLYQHSKENGERGYSVRMNGLNFLKNAEWR